MPGPTAAVVESPHKIIVCISFPMIGTRMSTDRQEFHHWTNIFVIFEPPKSTALQYTQSKWLFDASLERVACHLNLVLQGEREILDELRPFQFSSYLFSWRELENLVKRTHGGNLDIVTRAQIQALEFQTPIDHIPSQSSRTPLAPESVSAVMSSGSSRPHHNANPSREQQQSDYELALYLQNLDSTDSDRQLALDIALSLPDTFKCGICLEDVVDEDLALLEQCQHKFCRECLRNYVVSQIRDRRFPIVCPTCMKDRSVNSGSEFNFFSF